MLTLRPHEDTPLTVVLANRVLLNDTDIEGSALTAVLDVGPTTGTLTLNANGTFTYTACMQTTVVAIPSPITLMTVQETQTLQP